MQTFDFYDEDEVENKILQEINVEITEISTDLEYIGETFTDLKKMIVLQGEDIDQISTVSISARDYTQAGLEDLEKAEKLDKKKYARNAAILLTSIGAGALGFILGPIVGVGTVISGIGIGSLVAYKVKDV